MSQQLDPKRYADEVDSFRQLIDEFGKTAPLARALGEKYPTVIAWRARNSIPRQYWDKFLEVARKRQLYSVTLPRLETLLVMRYGGEK